MYTYVYREWAAVGAHFFGHMSSKNALSPAREHHFIKTGALVYTKSHFLCVWDTCHLKMLSRAGENTF